MGHVIHTEPHSLASVPILLHSLNLSRITLGLRPRVIRDRFNSWSTIGTYANSVGFCLCTIFLQTAFSIPLPQSFLGQHSMLAPGMARHHPLTIHNTSSLLQTLRTTPSRAASQCNPLLHRPAYERRCRPYSYLTGLPASYSIPSHLSHQVLAQCNPLPERGCLGSLHSRTSSPGTWWTVSELSCPPGSDCQPRPEEQSVPNHPAEHTVGLLPGPEGRVLPNRSVPNRQSGPVVGWVTGSPAANS